MNAVKWIAVALFICTSSRTVALSQDEKPATKAPAKPGREAPSPNAFRLTVVTHTGSGNKYAGTKGSKVYVAINGSDEHRQRLRTRARDQFQRGATDTFEKLRFDYPIDDIKSIQVKIEGADLWHCEWISFQFFKDGKQSKVYKYAPNRFLSGGKENKAFHTVPLLEFKLIPKLASPAEAGEKPADKRAVTIE